MKVLWGWPGPSFIILRGFGPARRGPFVSAKGPKTILARARPLRGAWATVPNHNGCATRFAQTVLAKKSDSGRWPSRAQRNRGNEKIRKIEIEGEVGKDSTKLSRRFWNSLDRGRGVRLVASGRL